MLRRHLFLAALAASLIHPASAQSTRGTPRILQGPMLGHVDATSARVWMRLSHEAPAAIAYGRRPDLADAESSPAVRASAGRDRCVEVLIEDLEPGQTYYWRPLVEDEPDKYLANLPPFTLRTPAMNPDRVRLAFGSCARFGSDAVQPIWAAVRAADPDLFLWLGDNIYADSPDPAVLSEEYRRQRDVASLKPLLFHIPQLAIWDDHDFGLNNHDRTNPIRAEALEVFQRYWANPAYGTEDTPGVFFRTSRGGLDMFFVDVRYHRAPNRDPDVADKTMLGAGQLAWLKDGLRTSQAPFKLLIGGSGWSSAKGEGGDSWAAFLTERDALFDWITSEAIGGGVLVSGDTHVGELNCIPWSERGGYDFYDLVSSPLAQTPGSSWLDRTPELRIRSVYAQSPNFGQIDVDVTGDDPTLVFTLRDVEGRSVWNPLTLRASELQPGVRSWDRKITKAERARRDAAERK